MSTLVGRIALADMPGIPSKRSRIGGRVFGVASGGVFRGMATLAQGTGGAQLIAVAAVPILTRLYSPEDFGVLAVFVAIVSIFAPVVTLRYVLALPLFRHDGMAMNLLILSLGLMLGLSALLGFALWTWGAPLFALFSANLLAPWWWLIVFGVLGTAAYDMFAMWGTRQRAYRLIAQTSLTQSAAGATIKIVLGLLSLQPLGLLIGHVMAQAAGFGRLLTGFRNELRANLHYVRLSRIRIVAWRHRGFPIWRLPSQFLMAFSMQAPLLFVSALYDGGTAGQFALAMTAIALPMNLVGRATSQAYYGEAAAVHRDPEKLWHMSLSVQLRLALFAVPSTAMLFFAAEPLFALVFGDEWRQAGRFTSILAIFLLLQFTSAPLVQALNIFDKQGFFLFVNLFRVAGLITIYGVALNEAWVPENFVWAISAFLSIFYAGMSVYILLIIRHQIRS